ncbi:MAG: hypothetical protein A3E80_06500 [Chlamydiae bacterium RIFCSPHIGHO2_12_FULL_49_9]|nr:MAG: hypothetical protein A3E80_06500 [Chlamydiae bacterium RIFCSPHIGHO2_12_FULL_49_9]
MFKRAVFFSLLVFSLGAQEKQIELFMDWRWEAKGQELFPLREDEPEPHPLLTRIRRNLLERGWDICSWERDRYRPWLMSWKEVVTWRDFVWWLRIGLPGKAPFREKDGLWIFWSLGPKVKNFNFSRIPKEKLVLFTWEPPTVQAESHDPKMWEHFGKIFTWDDALIDNKRFFKFHYPCLKQQIDEVISFKEKKFCVLINSRLCSKHPKQIYREREKTIRFFEDKVGELDLFGRFWEKRGFKNYRGTAADKIGTLKNYKFCICYENTRDVLGYVTEKIFDCFAGKVVPIYWGASNIADYIPKECFIDRRKFKDEQALYDFLKSVTEEQYEAYIESAAKFIKSEKAKVFTEDYFLETFLKVTEEQKPSL